MKKYRLGYDYTFLPSESFRYKGDFIGSMSVYVLFKVFDKKGNEVLFGSDELTEHLLYFENGNSCFLMSVFNCFIDQDNILDFIQNTSILKSGFDYNVSFEVYCYTKNINNGISDGLMNLSPVLIEENEFIDIMRSNIQVFDNSNNKPTKTTRYFTEELKDSELPKVLGKKYSKVKPKVVELKEKYRVLTPMCNKNIGDIIEPMFKGDEDYLACNWPLEMQPEDWEDRLSLCLYSSGRCYGKWYGCIREMIERRMIEQI